MPTTVKLDLEAPRWTNFIHSFRFEGVNLTGASFSAQVRNRKDGGFIYATADSGFEDGTGFSTPVVTTEVVAGIPGVTVSTFEMRLSETVMNAMGTPTQAAGADEAGEDGELCWDMLITAPSFNQGLKFRAFEGMFLVKAGVAGSS